MFVSHPEYEFPFPPDLDQPGCQHWRIVELTLHASWFLVSVEIVDPEQPDCTMVRTLCIAWDSDLAELLGTLEPRRVKGIVCMMPAWQSPSGQWTSREIREVWLHRSAHGQHVVLVDSAGQKFDCGLVPEDAGHVETELLVQVSPRPAARRTTTRPTGRRSRQPTHAGKADA